MAFDGLSRLIVDRGLALWGPRFSFSGGHEQGEAQTRRTPSSTRHLSRCSKARVPGRIGTNRPSRSRLDAEGRLSITDKNEEEDPMVTGREVLASADRVCQATRAQPGRRGGLRVSGRQPRGKYLASSRAKPLSFEDDMEGRATRRAYQGRRTSEPPYPALRRDDALSYPCLYSIGHGRLTERQHLAPSLHGAGVDDMARLGQCLAPGFKWCATPGGRPGSVGVLPDATKFYTERD